MASADPARINREPLLSGSDQALRATYIGCAILFGVPLFLALLAAAEHHSESLAVRYFASAMVVDGHPENVWVGPGHLISSVQHAIYFFIDRVLDVPASDLPGRFHAFGYLSNCFVVALNSVVLLAIYRCRVFSLEDKLILAALSIVPVLATGSAGLYYSNLPDYYHLNIVLVTASVALFARNLRDKSPSNLNWLGGLLGLFVGIAASNKITMIPIAAATFLPLLHPAARLGGRLALKATAISILCAACAYLFVLLLFHGVRPSLVVAGLIKTRVFLSSLPTESNPGELIAHYLVGHSYAYMLTAFVMSLPIALLFWRQPKEGSTQRATMLVGIVIASLSYLVVLIKKPTGTTFFEISNALVALTAMAILCIEPTRVRRATTAIVALIMGAAVVMNLSFADQYNNMRADKLVNQIGWALFWRTQALGKPVVVVIPDNRYVAGGPYAALLKGVSDQPTWNITTGRIYLDRLHSPVFFRTDVTNPTPDVPYDENAVILWFDVLHFQPLPDRYPSLREAVKWRRCESNIVVPTIIQATTCIPALPT